MTSAGVNALLADVLATLEPICTWPLPRVDRALVAATYESLVPITALPLSVRAFEFVRNPHAKLEK